MKEDIKELIDKYTGLRDNSKSMMCFISDQEDIIKIQAGITTLNLIIEDLNKLIK